MDNHPLHFLLVIRQYRSFGNVTNNIVRKGKDFSLYTKQLIHHLQDINYTVTYIFVNAFESNNTSSIARTITINPDITAPVITLNGQSSITLSVPRQCIVKLVQQLTIM